MKLYTGLGATVQASSKHLHLQAIRDRLNRTWSRILYVSTLNGSRWEIHEGRTLGMGRFSVSAIMDDYGSFISYRQMRGYDRWSIHKSRCDFYALAYMIPSDIHVG